MSDAFHTPRITRLRTLNTSNTPKKSPAFEIPPSPCLKQLGFGTGVKVLLYERSPRSGGPRSPWAIKKLSNSHVRGDIANRLEEEAKILKTLNHPNIVGYRGYKRAADGSRILALETGRRVRSLYDVMEEIRDDSDPESVSAKNVLFVVKQICQALEYLHTEKKLLHGDIKAGNVLIVGDFDAVKLCDFGVTLPLDENGQLADESKQYIGTEPWSAKEVIEEETISHKTDIYALGCTIFEMLALDTPHADKLPPIDDPDEDPDESLDDSEYQDALGSRPELPEHLQLDDTYEKVLSIFYAATMDDPDQRPSAAKIIELLSDD